MVVGILGVVMTGSCSDRSASSALRVLPSVIPSDLVGQASKFVFAEQPGAGSWTLFGLAGSDPFGSQDALVEVVLHSSDPPVTGSDTVRGGRAAAFSEHDGLEGTMRSLSWNENPSTRVTVDSFTLDKAQLKQLVEGLKVTGDKVTGNGTGSQLRVVGVVPLPIYTSGYSVTYGAGDRFLNVDVHPTSGDELLQYRWAHGVPATVNGRAVIQLLAERGAIPGYVFEYRPGLTVKIDGSVSDAELRAAVSSVRPVSDDQYAAIPVRK